MAKGESARNGRAGLWADPPGCSVRTVSSFDGENTSEEGKTLLLILTAVFLENTDTLLSRNRFITEKEV